MVFHVVGMMVLDYCVCHFPFIIQQLWVHIKDTTSCLSLEFYFDMPIKSFKCVSMCVMCLYSDFWALFLYVDLSD